MTKPYYEDEAVTLYHGDCLDVLPTLEVMSVGHTISDPPYSRDVYLRLSQPKTKDGSGTPGRLSVPLKGADGRKIHNIEHGALARMAAGDIGHIDDILRSVAGQIARVTKRWAIVFSDVESTHLWRSALMANGPMVAGSFAWGGMRYIRTGAWVKPDAMPQMTGDRPGTGFEACTITHGSWISPMKWSGGGSLAVWTHFTSKGEARPDHPCPKPLGLMVELVTLFTDEGETILDPFAGSGTTGVAAKLNGRKAILIEKSEAYCEVAAKRLRETHPGELFAKLAKAKPVKLGWDNGE